MTGQTNDATDAQWTAAAERMLADLQRRCGTMDEELRDATASMQHMTPRQRAVAAMLLDEDERLLHMLVNVHRRLDQWRPLDDHVASWADSRLTEHLAIDRNLACAVADLVDVVTQAQIEHTAEQVADRMLAEILQESAAYRSHAVLRLTRLHSCISDLRDREPGQVEREQLLTLAGELLHLCDHLGITRQPAAGQGVPHE